MKDQWYPIPTYSYSRLQIIGVMPFPKGFIRVVPVGGAVVLVSMFLDCL
jgi:hypothetical protein